MYKYLLSVIIGICVLMFSSAAAAQAIDCSKLDLTSMSQSQMDAAKAFCTAPQNIIAEQSKEVTPDKVREWASLGQDFANAITSTAKGLGQTANDFLFTPVGILIAFYFLWSKIGGILIGIPFLIGVWILYWSICSRYTTKAIEYVQVPILWGAFSIRKISSVRNNESDNTLAVWSLLAIALFIVSGFIIGLLIL